VASFLKLHDGAVPGARISLEGGQHVDGADLR
jgi:hypothetical protein